MINIRTIVEKFLGKPIIDKIAIDEFILEIQKTMLLADIPSKTVFTITQRLKQRIADERFPTKQMIIKILYEEFKNVLGDEYKPDLRPRRIMFVGLYGSGKTTTVAKLWKYFSDRGIATRVISFDDERPAAKDQLRQLVRDYTDKFNPKENEMWLIDTPGKSVEDNAFIEKLKIIKNITQPDDIFLVIGADTGKYAAKLAQGFSELGITGIVITKIDGSGKAGGAFIAVKELNVKVTFVGYGEKITDITPFNPDDILSRMFGFINPHQFKEIQQEIDDQQFEYNFETYMREMKSLSGKNIDDFLVGMGIETNLDQSMKIQEILKKLNAMIDSMTPEERKKPDLLKSSDSRIKRIAKGAGLKEIDVRNMLNRFFQSRKMFEKIKHDKGFLNILKRIKF